MLQQCVHPNDFHVAPILLQPWFGALAFRLADSVGYAINPVRDLGPRLAHAILLIANKGSSDWGYAIVPIMGPLLGGGLAGLVLHAIMK